MKINTKEDEQYNIHNAYDVFFKDLFDFKQQATINLVDRKIIIHSVEKSEFINQLGGQLIIDRLIRSYDVMFIIEFQKRHPTRKDKFRYGAYQTAVMREKNCKAVIIVVDLSLRENYTEQFGYEPEYSSRIYYVSLLEYNTEENLNSIRDKEEFNDDDIVTLLTLPLMEEDIKRRKEIIFETAHIANQIRNISKDDLIRLKTLQLILAQAEIVEEEFDELVEIVVMNDIELKREILKPVYESYVEDERKAYDEKIDAKRKAHNEEIDAERKAHNEKIEDIAKEMLREGDDIEKVSRITKLDKNRILAISALIK
ncbi:MAG: hypothetical protein IJP12_03525 [Methanobrevibacter sp.]|nr:hypothetical protein [Methanobrevibacter sp.]